MQQIIQEIINIGDCVRIGEIDGTVEKIAISVVPIRNSAQSISTVPTYSILNSNVTNFRGISESRARRVKRVFYINMETVNFCDAAILKPLKKSPYISKDVIDKIALDKAEKNLTNIKLFKLFIQEYLKINPAVYTEGFTFQ